MRRPEAEQRGTTVVLLGTSGGPVPAAERAMSAQAVLVNGSAYLIDCGSGTVGRLVQAGIPHRSLRALFVTHLHADHVMDYFATVACGKPFAPGHGYKAPLQVHGPGMTGLHRKLFEAYDYAVGTQYGASRLGPDLRDLVEVHDLRPPDVGAGPAGPLAPELEPFPVYADDHVRVSATLTEHPPVFPSFAFRLETEDGSVVISGDGVPSPNVTRIAAGADLLVHEAMHAQAMLEHGAPEPLVRALRRSHTDVGEVGEVAARAGVKQLVLSHLIPLNPGNPQSPSLPDERWIEPVRRSYAGPVAVGADLERFPVG